MALLNYFRRINRSRPIIFSLCSHFSHLFPHQSILSESGSPFLFQAFHRTSFRQFKHAPHSVSLHRVHSQRFYEIINIAKDKDEIDETMQSGVDEIIERVKKVKDFTSGDEAIAFLNYTNAKPNKDLIFYAIWALREEWKLAFLVFKWGEKWDCVVEKTWYLMIWLLGNHKKFSTSWTLIHELYQTSRDTQQALLILIDRYAAANYVYKAIETFHLMQKFKFSPDQQTYFSFLEILCEHGNIEEAEEFMFINKKFFPLETESFNIILNGWCNIAIDIYEAKRVWREMSNNCILPDGESYTYLISCHSSVGNLFDSLRLYDEMKKRGWVPGADVYESLIYVLTCENCLSEALKILDRMKELGLQPDSICYNSIILPLCEAAKFKEARTILATMIKENISPTIATYHALLVGENIERILGVLRHLRKADLGPTSETFLLILSQSFEMSQPQNALKLWLEMKLYKVMPDHEHYKIMVEGLVKCGMIAKARELYNKMISVGLVDHPSLKKLIEESHQVGVVHARKRSGQMTALRCAEKVKGLSCGSRSAVRNRRHGKYPEKTSVT